jgi:hypothetical protein
MGDCSDISEVSDILAQALNAHVVETLKASTSLYSLSKSGVHLAVLAKQSSGGDEVSVQFKCTDKDIAAKLTKEIKKVSL